MDVVWGVVGRVGAIPVAQGVRFVGLPMTSIHPGAGPWAFSAASLPTVPSAFAAYWAPSISPAPAAPVGVAFEEAPRSERERRVGELVARTVLHFQTTMRTGPETFDATATVFSQVGPVTPGRRLRSRRFGRLLDESKNLNDPSVTVDRVFVVTKPAPNIKSPDGIFTGEAPSILMAVLVIAAIAGSIGRAQLRFVKRHLRGRP
ncbi:MAG: hypothetical protein FD126_2057 [Elusimicrobia bacterium]|nr:MAG: hypothetical protein FD126_2057 [Elusimicrobiota bacterium]